MKESKIFTKAELQEMERRKKGDKSDKTGIFTSRIKPKILELFEWFKKRKELHKLVTPAKHNSTPDKKKEKKK